MTQQYYNCFLHTLFAVTETPLCPGNCYSQYTRLQHLWEILQEGEIQHLHQFQWLSKLFWIFLQIYGVISIFLGLPEDAGSDERHNSGYRPSSSPSNFQGLAEDGWWYVSVVSRRFDQNVLKIAISDTYWTVAMQQFKGYILLSRQKEEKKTLLYFIRILFDNPTYSHAKLWSGRKEIIKNIYSAPFTPNIPKWNPVQPNDFKSHLISKKTVNRVSLCVI